MVTGRWLSWPTGAGDDSIYFTSYTRGFKMLSGEKEVCSRVQKKPGWIPDPHQQPNTISAGTSSSLCFDGSHNSSFPGDLQSPYPLWSAAHFENLIINPVGSIWQSGSQRKTRRDCAAWSAPERKGWGLRQLFHRHLECSHLLWIETSLWKGGSLHWSIPVSGR